MCEIVPYFVILRYRNPKLTVRRRFYSYHTAEEFVSSVVRVNEYEHAVMPTEIKFQISNEAHDLSF